MGLAAVTSSVFLAACAGGADVGVSGAGAAPDAATGTAPAAAITQAEVQPVADAGPTSLTGQYASVEVTDFTLVESTTVQLTFGEDGRLHASAGCNQIGGDFSVQDGVLVVGQLSMTRRGCQPELMAQDQWLAGLLTSNPTVTVSGDEVELVADSAGIRLTSQSGALGDPAPRPDRG